MSKKNSTIINIVAIISLLIFGYLLFFTVYRQMISQNEGFFYVIVFGGILVLVYILLSLMTKLLAFSTESEGNNVFIILETIFIIVMSVLFVKFRISYSSTVPAEESIIYHAAELIDQGALSVGGMDIFPQLLNNPQTFIMGYFLAFIFKFGGEDPSLVIYLNTALLLATSLIVFGITRRLSSRICSLLAFVACLFMPTFDFSVYSYNSQLLYAFVVAVAMLFTVLLIKQTKSKGSDIACLIFAGIFWGLSFAMVPAGILMLIFIMIFNRRKSFAKKSYFILIIAFAVFLGIAFLKSLSLELSFGEIMTGFITSFNPFISESGESLEISEIFSSFNDKLDSQQKAINDNYYFLETIDGETYSSVKVAWLQLGNQILYMFIIILSIACSFYMIRSKHPRAIPVLSSIMASFIMIFLCSGQEYNIVFFIMLIIISGSISLQYMYENHHALADESFHELLEEEEEETQAEAEPESEEDEEAFMLRAQALIFVGANETYYQQIKFEEKHKENKRSTDEGFTQTDTTENPEISQQVNTVPATVTEDKVVDDNVADDKTDIEEALEEIEYLETPLPMPPKHVHKELDYDKKENAADDDDNDFDFDVDIDDSDFKDFDVD